MPGELLRGLEQPEYVHVLLNPVPIYGLAMGLAALMIAMGLRSREARICACAIIFLSSASAWPVSHYGQQGYFRVKAMSDSEGKNWLEEHKRRGEDLVFAFYIVAAIALFSLGAEWRRSRAALPLTIATFILAASVLGIGAYIGYPGGHIRHRVFRFEPAPDRTQQEQQASD
ncbi:MAG: hypothetical protein WBL39_11115 [Terrimicrobiaceae bacterium]